MDWKEELGHFLKPFLELITVFNRLRAFSACLRALNRPTTVVVAFMGSRMSCPFQFGLLFRRLCSCVSAWEQAQPMFYAPVAVAKPTVR